MAKLQQRLEKEIQQNHQVKIVERNQWCIPVRTVEVTYEPIRRSTMDVLMKMLLISMQEADFRDAKELSELLLVDPLFIHDLVSIMLRVRLIEKVDDYYRLTTKGTVQLERGIFEEELDLKTASLLYSPCHEAFLSGDLESIEEFDELPPLYRYIDEEAEQKDSFEEHMLIEALTKEDDVEEDTSSVSQTIISKIASSAATQINDIPCFEFIVYDKAQDIYFARVWNTLLAHWDEVLEQQLTEKERLKWRENNN
ncbi:hypothetical protein AEA09_17105 [Lysinibacillus contaminans]|uniref:Transcriptional regulator n=1 Tax=Lysinibacillus contaminans TaxID=1293441 RepID=A0ABR5JWC6_9BACI|nr:hypothetical protein [Lysinibacillus contaminans]KOS66465.1 hypothetical protein AEA09_17105 [Lysinibacillus contaminans]